MLKSLLASLLFAFSAQASPGHGKFKKNGPCKNIQCRALEGEQKKSCIAEKKQCLQEFFEAKMVDAEKNGISTQKKKRWERKLEKKISKAEKKGASEEKLTFMREKLNKVKGLKEKK